MGVALNMVVIAMVTMQVKSVIQPMKPSIRNNVKATMKKFVTHLTKNNVKVMGKKCKAIHTSKQERKCFDVNELLCSLKENVQYEEIPAVFTIQKCHKMKERVCDTVYETELTEKDDYKCITVVNPYCAKKERTVYDKTCKTMVNFDCKAQGGNSYGAGSSSNS